MTGKVNSNFKHTFPEGRHTALSKLAFTLAEVLIVIAILGIIAELVLPTLYADSQKKVYVTKLEKFYSEFQNGTKAYMANQGCNTLDCTGIFDGPEDIDWNPDWVTRVNDYVEQNFKVVKNYKINFNNSELIDFRVRYLAGEWAEYLTYNVFLNDYSFVTPDGVMIGINDTDWQNCGWYLASMTTPYCAVIDVDVNGFKGPNTLGRDTFQFYLQNDGTLATMYSQAYATSVKSQWTEYGEEVASLFYDQAYWAKSEWFCGKPGKNTIDPKGMEIQGVGCTARIIDEGWEMNY